MKHNPTTESKTSREWLLALFSKSVLKQAKLRELSRALGDTENLDCLDLGSDNGVLSYLLRQQGGKWTSGDLTNQAVQSISSLIGEEAILLDGKNLPFPDDSFDVVCVIDMLEHVEDDRYLVDELARILRSEGRLVLNVPNIKPFSLLRAFRHLIGQTDEAHGHLRPGYSSSMLHSLCQRDFDLISERTYSGFFSELSDTLIVFAYSLLSGKKGHSEQQNGKSVSKGLVVTEKELKKFEKNFRLYSLIYPAVWFFSRLDVLLFFIPGYMRISTFSRRFLKSQGGD